LKLVTAIIKPFKVEEVRASLDKIGVSGIIEMINKKEVIS